MLWALHSPIDRWQDIIHNVRCNLLHVDVINDRRRVFAAQKFNVSWTENVFLDLGIQQQQPEIAVTQKRIMAFKPEQVGMTLDPRVDL